MAGETSHYSGRWRRSKVTSYIAAGKRACPGELPLIKPSDLRRLSHYHENSKERCTPTMQSPPTRCLSRHTTIMGAAIQNQISAGTQTISGINDLVKVKLPQMTPQSCRAVGQVRERPGASATAGSPSKKSAIKKIGIHLPMFCSNTLFKNFVHVNFGFTFPDSEEVEALKTSD